MRAKQRGSLLFDGIIALVVLGLIAGAVIWANHFIYVTWEEPAEKRGAANQLAVDAPILEQVKTERDNAREDTRSCVAKAQIQSDEIARWKARSDANAQAAKEAKAQAQREATAAAPKIADLQAKAAAAPKLMACEQELALSKESMRDELRRRRGISAPGK